MTSDQRRNEVVETDLQNLAENMWDETVTLEFLQAKYWKDTKDKLVRLFRQNDWNNLDSNY